MESKKTDLKEQSDRLIDELIENIINTSDSEILQEVEEEYGDSNYEAKKFLELLEKARIEVGKNKQTIISKYSNSDLKTGKNKKHTIGV